MSAECHQHGCDIVYPEGTWPIGECPECRAELEGRELRERAERAERELEQLRASGGLQWRVVAHGSDGQQYQAGGPWDELGAAECFYNIVATVKRPRIEVRRVMYGPWGETNGEPWTVDEGVAIMQAWRRYLGVSDFTTVIVPPDFAEGYRAALRDSRPTDEQMREVARIMHIMGCVPNCQMDDSGWVENARIVAEVFFPTMAADVS